MVLTGFIARESVNAAYDLEAEYVAKPVHKARIARFLLARPDFEARLTQATAAWRERYGLSDAEADVLHRAAAGETRETIAAARQSSVLTIKAQVKNLLRKTGDDSLHVAVERLLRTLAGDAPRQ
jgi:DNA-binding CsgD family transcriptional regulator